MSENDELAQALEILRKEYLGSLPDVIHDIELQVVKLHDAGCDSEAYQDLIRKVHSLKGTAGSYGFFIVSTIAHHLEDILSECSDCFGDDASSSALVYIDLFNEAISEIASGRTSFSAIEKGLDRERASWSRQHQDVLLVTASRATQSLCQGLLQDLPIRLTLSEDGLDALHHLLHKPYRLLITAAELPNLNAFSLISALRLSRTRNSDIPVILINSDAPLDSIPGLALPDASIRRDTAFAETFTRTVTSMLPANPMMKHA